MKKLLFLIFGVSVGIALQAQSLQITYADTLVQGHVSNTNEIPAKVTVKNVGSTAKDYLLKRIDKNYNSLTDSNAFCWGQLCYQPHISVAPMAQTIQPGEEFKGFIGYAYPDDGGQPAKGDIRYVVYDQNDPNDSVSFTITYETTADFSLRESNQSEVSIFPNPTSGMTTLEYDLGGASSGTFEIINLVGSKVYQKSLSATRSELQFDAGRFEPGVYFYSFIVDDKVAETRKLVIK